MAMITIPVTSEEGIKLLGQLNKNANQIDKAFNVESELGANGLIISGKKKI